MRRPILIGVVIGAVLVAAALLGPMAIEAAGAEPKECALCHSMETNVHAFTTSISGHKDELSCSDCHLPHDSALGAYAAKYSTGLRHIWTTATGNTPEEIKLRLEDREMVIANCVRCHSEEEHIQQNGKNSCLNCHSTNPHGDKGEVVK